MLLCRLLAPSPASLPLSIPPHPLDVTRLSNQQTIHSFSAWRGLCLPPVPRSLPPVPPPTPDVRLPPAFGRPLLPPHPFDSPFCLSSRTHRSPVETRFATHSRDASCAKAGLAKGGTRGGTMAVTKGVCAGGGEQGRTARQHGKAHAEGQAASMARHSLCKGGPARARFTRTAKRGAAATSARSGGGRSPCGRCCRRARAGWSAGQPLQRRSLQQDTLLRGPHAAAGGTCTAAVAAAASAAALALPSSLMSQLEGGGGVRGEGENRA